MQISNYGIWSKPIFTIKPEMKLDNLCGEQFSWNPLPTLAGWTFISKLLWFSLTWKQIIWKLCWGNGRSAGSETIFSAITSCFLAQRVYRFLEDFFCHLMPTIHFSKLHRGWKYRAKLKLSSAKCFISRKYLHFIYAFNVFLFNLAHVKPKELQN